MPKTATPRPLTEAEKRQRYARLTEQAKREREASMSPPARMLGFGDAERGLVRDTASAANDVAGRGVMASLIGLPGDLAGMGENGIRGLLGLPQVQPWGGSEHIGQTMQDYGLVSSERRPKTELLASLISPSAAVKTAVNAPKTAMNLLRMADNWDAPPSIPKLDETGAIVRRFGIPDEAGEIIYGYDETGKMLNHPSYRLAKNGSLDSGYRVAKDLVPPSILRGIDKISGKNPVLVPMYAPEAHGYNKIPVGIAARISEKTGIPLELAISQSNVTGHTGAKAMDRMVSRSDFSGEIVPDSTHILVDDVITMGGTMGDAANYIQRLGGNIGGVVSLINKSRGDSINAPQSLIDLIRQRFGNAPEEEFGIVPEALTRPEAEYLARFGSTERLRDAAASARAKK